MASITIRNLEDDLKRRLRIRQIAVTARAMAPARRPGTPETMRAVASRRSTRGFRPRRDEE